MARFSDAAIHRVREATDLVELAGRYTELRRAGTDRMVGRCPLHDERTPSFTISPAKQLFKCFGCDAGGDALSLVQLKEGLDFPAALEFLAQRAGVQLEVEDPGVQARRARRARELVALDRAAAFYAAHLRSPRSKGAAQAAEYLAARGINEETRQQFEVGFAPADGAALLHAARGAGFSVKELTDVGLVSRPRGGGPPQDRFRGRLMFPVCDVQGRVLGFGARKLGRARGPKYVNSPATAIFNKSELLYGAHHARAAAAKAGAVIVVEGYIDALAMHQAGIANTVALMGTAISEPQIARSSASQRPSCSCSTATTPALKRSCARACSHEPRALRCSSRRFRPTSTPPLWCNATEPRRQASLSRLPSRSHASMCCTTSNVPT